MLLCGECRFVASFITTWCQSAGMSNTDRSVEFLCATFSHCVVWEAEDACEPVLHASRSHILTNQICFSDMSNLTDVSFILQQQQPVVELGFMTEPLDERCPDAYLPLYFISAGVFSCITGCFEGASRLDEAVVDLLASYETVLLQWDINMIYFLIRVKMS